jgi:hypothetical protein
MSEEALIQVARTSRSGDADEVQVELVKGETHIRVALTMEQFGNLMTGSAHVPCRVVRWCLEKD